MGLTSQASADKSQRWWHLSSIQLAGGIISIPVISVGAQILGNSGFFNTILSILLGNFIILLISICIVLISSGNRLNAVETVRQFVGHLGSKIFAFLVLLSMIGWVAWDLRDGIHLLELLPIFSHVPVGSLLGAAASMILLVGIRGLKAACLYAVIPLTVLLLITLFYVLPSDNLSQVPLVRKSFSLSGVSLVISSNVGSVVDYPTFFRHRKTKKDSLIALFIIFVFTCIIQMAGLYMFKMMTFDQSFINSIASEGNIKIGVLASFLIISSITGVCWNIYAASVGWESLFPVFKDRTEYAVIGLLATLLLGYKGLEEVLVLTASFCDTLMSAVGGVLIYEFISLQQFTKEIHLAPKEVKSNYLSWVIGSILGALAFFNFIKSSDTAVFTALIGGFISSIILNTIRKIALN